MAEPITLVEALTILDVRDPSRLVEADFTRLMRRARRRWHPDTIAASDPSPETLELYTRNFRLIQPALALLREYVEGRFHSEPAVASEYEKPFTPPSPPEPPPPPPEPPPPPPEPPPPPPEPPPPPPEPPPPPPEPPPPPPEPPEEIIRRNAPSMQEELRAVWEMVQRTGYKLREEVVVVFEGAPVPDLLRGELAEEVPVLAVAAFVGVVLIVAPFYVVPEDRLFVLAVLAVHGAFCALALLPLARVWLPSWLWEIVYHVLSGGLTVYNSLALFEHWSARNPLGLVTWVLGIGLSWPVKVARLVQAYLLAPLYRLAGWLFRGVRLGVVSKTQRYYGGLAAWYVEELLAGDPRGMSAEELLHLSRLYAELRDVPGAE